MDDVKLPESVEEYQRALREAFADGAHWEWTRWRDDVGTPLAALHFEEARRRYPITRKVPRTLTLLPSPITARVESGGSVEFSSAIYRIPARSTEALADLIANPFEEIEE